MTQTAVLTRRRAPVTPALVLGLVSGLIALVGNVAAEKLTDWTPEWSWLAVPLLGLAVSVVAALATSRVEQYFPDGTAVEVVHGSRRPLDPRRRRGTSITVVLLVMVLVLGVGGLAVAWVGRYAVGWVTGNETGTSVLVDPRSSTSKHVTLDVLHIEETEHFTRVTAVATNGLANQISLRRFMNCTLTADSGTTLQADGFKGDWVEEVGPGEKHQGVIVFPGHLDAAADTATLAFASIWEFGNTGPKSLRVKGLEIDRS